MGIVVLLLVQNNTLIAFQEQAHQDRLQSALNNLLDCVEEARHTTTGTPTHPRLIRTCSNGPAGALHTGNNDMCGTSSVSAEKNTDKPSPTVNHEMQRLALNVNGVV